MAKKEKERTLVEYADETTIHGLHEFHKFNSPFARFVWLALFLMSIGYMGYEIYRVIDQYFTSPSATKISAEPLSEFPPVSICPFEFVNADNSQGQLTDLLPYMLYALAFLRSPNSAFMNAVTDTDGIANKTSTQEEFNAFLKDNQLNVSTVTEFIQYMSFDMATFIKAECQSCKKSVKITKHVTNYGVCYLINGGEFKTSSKTRQAQLTIEINHRLLSDTIESSYSWMNLVNAEWYQTTTPGPPKRRKRQVAPTTVPAPTTTGQYDYVDYSDLEAVDVEESKLFGLTFMVYMGEDARSFDSENAMMIQAEGTAYTVYMRAIHRKLNDKFSDCWKTSHFDYQNRLIPCESICYQEALEACGVNCSLYRGAEFDDKLASQTLCAWIEKDNDVKLDLTAAEEHCFEAQLYGSETSDGEAYGLKCAEDEHWMTQFCRTACSYYLFEPSLNRLEHGNPNTTYITFQPLHPESIEVMQEIATYSFSSFVSNVGGLMGLFCGASVLSIAHMFYYFCCVPLERRWKASKDGSTSARKGVRS